MDIGLILSIAAGVVLGGLILIYRNRIAGKAKEAAELSAEGAKITGRGLYAIRVWIVCGIIVAAIAATFAFTRVEKNLDHWMANQKVKSEMRAACEEDKGFFKDGREYLHCTLLTASDKGRTSWLFDRSGCRAIVYVDGEHTSDEYVDVCAKAAFQPAIWHQILRERRQREEELNQAAELQD